MHRNRDQIYLKKHMNVNREQNWPQKDHSHVNKRLVDGSNLCIYEQGPSMIRRGHMHVSRESSIKEQKAHAIQTNSIN